MSSMTFSFFVVTDVTFSWLTWVSISLMLIPTKWNNCRLDQDVVLVIQFGLIRTYLLAMVILFHQSFLVLSLKCKPTALCFQKLAVAVALRELLELFGPKDCTRDIYGDETEPPHSLQGKRHFLPKKNQQP